MHWLAGYDSFGYCFCQCRVLRANGHLVLLTRAPDVRQAQHARSSTSPPCVRPDSS
jgi:Xaa-Pro dipeptidase